MFTQTKDVNVADNYHLIMILSEYGIVDDI
jgi:hypothetical protein